MWPTLWFVFVFLSAAACQTAQSPAYDPIGDYERLCSAEMEETVDCAFLRGLVKQAVLEALETIEFSGDQRGVEEALAALELDEEPEIQIAACRILGHFPEHPGIASRLPGLLTSPYPAVQRLAAEALSRNPDGAIAGLGRQWLDNHQGKEDWEPFEENPVPAQPSRLGVSDYPGSVRFPPAESPISFAWLTADPPAKAMDFYRRKTGKIVLDIAGWEARQEAGMARQQRLAGDYMNRPELAEIQRLVEQYSAHQDPEVLKKIEALQRKLESLSEEMRGQFEDPVTQAAAIGDAASTESLRFMVLEEREGKPTQLLISYREAVSGKTVVRLIWDPDLYGRAWD